MLFSVVSISADALVCVVVSFDIINCILPLAARKVVVSDRLP